MVYCSGLENLDGDWLVFPETGGFGYFCATHYAQFLHRSGYSDGSKVGTPPVLPKWAVQTPEHEFRRVRATGLARWTYFALGTLTGRIKIGQSKEPEYRVSQLQYSARGEPAELILALRGGHMERTYHRAFADHLEGHEWFAPHPDILAEIERLRSVA